MEEYKVIGLMSGTCLDGVDIAYCIFTEDNAQWEFKILNAETVAYSQEWKKKLSSIKDINYADFVQTDEDYGHYLGKLTNDFIVRNKIQVDFVASHGHTVFHQPEKRLTVQIGKGEAIASHLKCPVIFDFRSLDVALGGQGAPLVPIGDKLLFGDYDYCINIGGFANISFDKNQKRLAYDICPANIIMNGLVQNIGKEFDEDGKIAKSGSLNESLLQDLNNLDYYFKDYTKSLGKEWVLEKFQPILDSYVMTIEDKLRTVIEHISFQITKQFDGKPDSNILFSGGGVKNKFLMERISQMTNNNIVIPDEIIIDFKEAMIFAFLGVLRLRNQINCLSSVTGASRDSVCGIIISPHKKV